MKTPVAVTGRREPPGGDATGFELFGCGFRRAAVRQTERRVNSGRRKTAHCRPGSAMAAPLRTIRGTLSATRAIQPSNNYGATKRFELVTNTLRLYGYNTSNNLRCGFMATRTLWLHVVTRAERCLECYRLALLSSSGLCDYFCKQYRFVFHTICAYTNCPK